jgi:hypothetical protein
MPHTPGMPAPPQEAGATQQTESHTAASTQQAPSINVNPERQSPSQQIPPSQAVPSRFLISVHSPDWHRLTAQSVAGPHVSPSSAGP